MLRVGNNLGDRVKCLDDPVPAVELCPENVRCLCKCDRITALDILVDTGITVNIEVEDQMLRHVARRFGD